ncbi:hypothetical protein FRB99_008293 [Tulasnella sp. 403]|nr:hypothetical protein FRB99_008293 [Tulasnella sp. 403]
MATHPPSPPPDSGWTSIRPYTPRLFLSVWEITSVSVTFTLRATLDVSFLKPPPADIAADTPERELSDLIEDGNEGKCGISEILRGGLAVSVNGSCWDKVIMNTEDDEEEALVTIYGLLPSQQYDIDLCVAASNENLRGVITTGTSTALEPTEVYDDTEPSPTLPIVPVPYQTATPETTPPSSPRRRTPSPPPVGHINVEERLVQLRATLAATLAERDSLTTQLKTSRKESHRVENALRSEIDTLKRTLEKNATTELRNRRKIDSVRRTVDGLTQAKDESEKRIADLTAALPDLEQRETEVMEEHVRVKEEAERSAAETDEALRSDKKRAEDLEAEMTELDSKLDAAKAHKDKLEDETLPELERQLAALLKDIETVEKGSAIHLPMEFNHELDYPHHYQTPPTGGPQASYNGGNGAYRQPPASRNGRPPPIQRPNVNQSNPTFSSSQKSLESMDAQSRAMAPAFYPHNTNTGSFPQIRHPSMNAHPPPRGLFVNNSAAQRPTHGQRPGSVSTGKGSNSSLNLGRTSQPDMVPSPAGSAHVNSAFGGVPNAPYAQGRDTPQSSGQPPIQILQRPPGAGNGAKSNISLVTTSSSVNGSKGDSGSVKLSPLEPPSAKG